MSKLLIALLILAFMASARAEDRLWVGLYLGENKMINPPAPEKLAHRLHEVFGFNHYSLLKGEEINLRSNWEHWVLSRKDFFMRVQPQPRQAGEPGRIDYEIYKDGFLIAKGKYTLNEAVPLFINGPDFHQGRLIFVVEAR